MEKQFDQTENRLFRWLKRLFRAQRDRYIAAVRREFRRAVDSHTEKAPAEVLNGINTQAQEEYRIMVEEALDEFTAVIDDAGRFGLTSAGLSPNLWDILNPNVLRFIDEKAFNFAGGLTDRISERLRDEMREAIRNGEGINEMVKRISDVFDGTVRAEAPRSRMIARTETTGLVNGGQRLAYEQNDDIIEAVEWLSSRDNRVRPTHTAADGQVVNLETGTFTVGGAQLRFPGDPQGPAREVVNCRCTVLPVLMDEAEIALSPGEFQTVADAQAWGNANYPDIIWDLEGVDPVELNQVAEQLDKLLQEWPEVSKRLQYVGTYANPNQAPTTTPGFDSDRVFAHARITDGALMAFNPAKLRDSKEFRRQFKEMWDGDWLTQGRVGREAHALTAHEFGHLTDVWLRQNQKLYSEVYRADGAGFLAEIHREFRDKHKATAKTSRYALQDEWESFAEGFGGSYETPPRSRSTYVKRVRRYREALAKLELRDFQNATEWRFASPAQRRRFAQIERDLREAAGLPIPQWVQDNAPRRLTQLPRGQGAEAEREWARDNLGIEFEIENIARVADEKNLLRSANRRLRRLFTEYPEADRDKLGTVKFWDRQGGRAEIDEADSDGFGTLWTLNLQPNQGFAKEWRRWTPITVEDGVFAMGDRAFQLDLYDADFVVRPEARQKFRKGSSVKSDEDVLTHEWAHIYVSPDMQRLADERGIDFNGIYDNWVETSSDIFSAYGATDWAEGISEAFVEIVNGTYEPGMLPREVESVFFEVLEELGGL